jgi:hypothetical protein
MKIRIISKENTTTWCHKLFLPKNCTMIGRENHPWLEFNRSHVGGQIIPINNGGGGLFNRGGNDPLGDGGNNLPWGGNNNLVGGGVSRHPRKQNSRSYDESSIGSWIRLT